VSAGNPDKVIYWHRELPHVDAAPLEKQTAEAASVRVCGALEHRNELWQRCYDDLMTRLGDRLH
jgi:hypothetical protein